jgi:oligopeptide/dipeptide ABC transporter ATP-binding protein
MTPPPQAAGSAGAAAAGGPPPLTPRPPQQPRPPRQPLLAVEDLEVSFAPDRRRLEVVRGVSFAIGRGECLGLVGESGSGKSLTALAVLRLVPPAARLGGRVLLAGREPGAPAADLLEIPARALRQVRGGRVGIVFQEPMAALNPFFTIGFQVAEAVAAHRPVSRREARAEAVRLLDRVALPAPRRRLDDYPNQLSGGQRQRVMLAMALAGGPDLLLADEPTTALDVTIQAQILELLEDLRQDLGLGVLLITHDMAIAAGTCDRVAVLYAGQVVEEAAVADLFAAPLHPYTRALLATLPHLGRPVPRGQLPVLPGQPAEPAARPVGCAFHPRCPDAMAVCTRLDPPETSPAPAPVLPPPPAPVLLAPPPAPASSPAAPAEPAAPATRRVRCWLHAPIPGGAAMAMPLAGEASG